MRVGCSRAAHAGKKLTKTIKWIEIHNLPYNESENRLNLVGDVNSSTPGTSIKKRLTQAKVCQIEMNSRDQ